MHNTLHSCLITAKRTHSVAECEFIIYKNKLIRVYSRISLLSRYLIAQVFVDSIVSLAYTDRILKKNERNLTLPPQAYRVNKRKSNYQNIHLNDEFLTIFFPQLLASHRVLVRHSRFQLRSKRSILSSCLRSIIMNVPKAPSQNMWMMFSCEGKWYLMRQDVGTYYGYRRWFHDRFSRVLFQCKCWLEHGKYQNKTLH